MNLVRWVAVAALVLISGAALADDQTLPPGRTGGGGANQAAGPGGQNPGQAGVIPLPKAAVFDIQLANLGAAPSEADKALLPRLSTALRDELALQNLFDVVAMTPDVRADVAKQASLRTCNGCAVDYAKRLGAQVVVTTELQKVSAAVSKLNVFVKPVGGGPEQSFTANVRGNDDRALDHAVKYVVDAVIVPKLARRAPVGR